MTSTTGLAFLGSFILRKRRMKREKFSPLKDSGLFVAQEITHNSVW